MSKEEIKEAVLQGTRLAFKRLVMKERRNNGYLILSKDGKIVRVKARDIRL